MVSLPVSTSVTCIIPVLAVVMPKASLKRDNDDEESDVEMEGVDLEDDEDTGADVVADEAMAEATVVPNDEDDTEEQDEETKALLQKEAAELEAARKERQELLQAAVAAPPDPKATPQSKMNFLMQQSDVFAQFLAGMY